MIKTIVNPHWTNNAETTLSAEFHYEDGRVLTASLTRTDTDNPDVQEIMSKYSLEQIKENTQKHILKLKKEQDKQKEVEQAAQTRMMQEKLFAIKLEIFEIDIVKNSINNGLKAKIRRAKSPFEAQAWATGLMMEEFNKQQTP